jgi:hypothetical protein
MRAGVRNLWVPFTVQGQATDPVFRPDVKSLAKEEIKRMTGDDPVKAATGLLKGLLGKKKQ